MALLVEQSVSRSSLFLDIAVLIAVAMECRQKRLVSLQDLDGLVIWLSLVACKGDVASTRSGTRLYFVPVRIFSIMDSIGQHKKTVLGPPVLFHLSRIGRQF